MTRQWSKAPCGTVAGYSRHQRRSEPPCDSCRLAKRAYNAEAQRRHRIEALETIRVPTAAYVAAGNAFRMELRSGKSPGEAMAAGLRAAAPYMCADNSHSVKLDRDPE